MVTQGLIEKLNVFSKNSKFKRDALIFQFILIIVSFFQLNFINNRLLFVSILLFIPLQILLRIRGVHVLYHR